MAIACPMRCRARPTNQNYFKGLKAPAKSKPSQAPIATPRPQSAAQFQGRIREEQSDVASTRLAFAKRSHYNAMRETWRIQ